MLLEYIFYWRTFITGLNIFSWVKMKFDPCKKRFDGVFTVVLGLNNNYQKLANCTIRKCINLTLNNMTIIYL